jgi:hypothetical protein
MGRFDVCASQRQPRGISATIATAFIFDVGILEAEAEEGRQPPEISSSFFKTPKLAGLLYHHCQRTNHGGGPPESVGIWGRPLGKTLRVEIGIKYHIWYVDGGEQTQLTLEF